MSRSESRARARLRLGAALLALWLLGPAWLERGARAEPGVAAASPVAAPSLALTLPRELHVGEHARFQLEVRLPAEAASPLLLTPFREGQALEVVKGRLLRSDALDPSAQPLHFELPVLARAPGVARIGVRLLAYVCAPGCRAVEVETRADVLVLP